jgi:hypothetical protein
MNIRTLPSWRQKEGAHTEILLYEIEDGEGQQHVSKENHSRIEYIKHSFSSDSLFFMI